MQHPDQSSPQTNRSNEHYVPSEAALHVFRALVVAATLALYAGASGALPSSDKLLADASATVDTQAGDPLAAAAGR